MADAIYKMELDIGDRKARMIARYGAGFVEITTFCTNGRVITRRQNFGDNQSGLGTTRIVHDPHRKPTL